MQPNNIFTELVALVTATRKAQKGLNDNKSGTDLRRKFIFKARDLEQNLDAFLAKNSAFLAESYTESLVCGFDHKPVPTPK